MAVKKITSSDERVFLTDSVCGVNTWSQFEKLMVKVDQFISRKEESLRMSGRESSSDQSEALEYIESKWDEAQNQYNNVVAIVGMIQQESMVPIGFKRMLMLQRAMNILNGLRAQMTLAVADARARKIVEGM